MFIDPATTWVHGTRLYLFGDKVPLSNDHQGLQYYQYLIGDKVPLSNDHLKLQFPAVPHRRQGPSLQRSPESTVPARTASDTRFDSLIATQNHNPRPCFFGDNTVLSKSDSNNFRFKAGSATRVRQTFRRTKVLVHCNVTDLKCSASVFMCVQELAREVLFTQCKRRVCQTCGGGGTVKICQNFRKGHVPKICRICLVCSRTQRWNCFTQVQANSKFATLLKAFASS